MVEIAEPARKMSSIAEACYEPGFGHHVFLHDGIGYTPDMTRKMIAEIQRFPMHRDDLIIAGYPKSGTNWLNITLDSLYPDWGTTRTTANGQIPELTVPDRPAIGFAGFESCLASPPPRLMKTHVPFEHTPRAFREDRVGRAIYITRNPKDVCDSYMNQLSGWLPADWSWEKHLEAFLDGQVFFGSWLRNVTSWHKKGIEDGVLHISFEEMQRNKRATIERIVEFVGPTELQTIDQVIAETDFDTMQKSELGKKYQPQMLRRSGKSGGWKSRFTVEQSERMDAIFGPTLAAAGISIDYGH